MTVDAHPPITGRRRKLFVQPINNKDQQTLFWGCVRLTLNWNKRLDGVNYPKARHKLDVEH
jgi:hypothetical protein